MRTVYRLIKAGKIPAVRVGRQWRFRKTDIDAWLVSQQAADAPATSDAPSDDPGPPLQPNNSRPHVLVVDDEPDVCALLSEMLVVLADYNVDVASDGPLALWRLWIGSYDLLIIDLRMLGMDGLSVIHEVRQLHAELPVIIMTGFSTEASAIEAVNLGVSGYLAKPLKVPNVLDVVAKALGE